MNLDQTTYWRNSIARLAPLFFILFSLSALDGLIAVFRQPLNALPLLAGETIEVNGPLPNKPADISELIYESTSQQIHLIFQAIHPGFWTGGTMWRGKIVIDADIKPGAYELQVRTKQTSAQKPFSVFKIQVCPDSKAKQAASLSLIQRLSGLSPWWCFGWSFMLTLFCMGAIYLLSHKREYLLQQMGQAEIYRIVKKDNAYEIGFSLGKRHGVLPGVSVTIVDQLGKTIGTAAVLKVFAGDSIALIGTDTAVMEGHIVSLAQKIQD